MLRILILIFGKFKLISITIAIFQDHYLIENFAKLSKPVLKFVFREPGGIEWLQK